jgi:hypothetical protein
VQQLQHRRVVLDRRGDAIHGGGVVDVAAGSGIGQQQVVADQRPQRVDVLRREAHPGGDLGGDGLPHDAVVAGIALADVVQEGGDEQQVRAVDVAGELGGGRRGLHQVPVDGVPVPRVPLRQGAHAVPLGQQPRQQALLVQLLEDGDGGAPAGQQPQERPADLRRPWLGHRRGVHGQDLQRVRGEQQILPRGGGRGPQQEAGVGGGLGALGEHHLVALADDALGERLPAHPAVPTARPADQRGLDPPPRLVGDEGQPAAGEAHLAEEGVLVGKAEGGGHRALLLADEDVDRAAGPAAQLVPDVEEEGVGLLHLGGGLVGELGGGRGAQHLSLAQAAVGLLEVGFEQEGQLADLAGPPAAQVAQLRQQAGGGRAPAAEGRRPEPRGELGVAGDQPGVEQAEPGLDVGGGDRDRLGDRAHRVVQPQAGVPHGVPEGVGERGDLGTPVVDQHEVQVAEGRRLAPAQAADGDQREPFGPAARRGGAASPTRRRCPGHRVGEQAAQPLVQHRHPFGAGQAGQRVEIEHPFPLEEWTEPRRPGQRVIRSPGRRALLVVPRAPDP